MAQFDPTPPRFNVEYNIGNVPNIGAGYAAGIAQAGQGLSEGAKDFMDVMNRRRNASDLIDVFSKHGVLDPSIAADLAKKGLGAQESALGMYAGQWVAQQAQERALQLQAARGQVEVSTAAGTTAATIQQYQKLGLLPPGSDPNKIVLNRTAASVPRAQPVTAAPAAAPPTAAPVNVSGSPTPSWAQSGGVATPQSNIRVTSVGPALGINESIPPGAVTKQMRNKDGTIVDGIVMPNGVWRAHPIQ